LCPKGLPTIPRQRPRRRYEYCNMSRGRCPTPSIAQCPPSAGGGFNRTEVTTVAPPACSPTARSRPVARPAPSPVAPRLRSPRPSFLLSPPPAGCRRRGRRAGAGRC
jgi:hypothetical protein